MTVTTILAGCGNMGYAMLSGWLQAAKLPPDEVLVVEPNADLRKRAESLAVQTVKAAGDIPPGITAPALVVFAVKPQIIREAVQPYRRFANGKTTFLSVAAGTGIAIFEEILGKDAPVIRCMPNTPAAIGKGMIVTTGNARVSTAAHNFTSSLLEANGEVAYVDDESLMDAVTAVSGSGPAYLFHFIECLSAAAEQIGLPAATAQLLATQTIYGAAALAAQSDEHPAQLREQVTSPNGTTAAALAVLMGENRLKHLLADAVEAARKRSVELGK